MQLQMASALDYPRASVTPNIEIVILKLETRLHDYKAITQ
jgi:hypothetical protein